MTYGRQKEATQALTVKTGGAYTANDVLHGLITISVANAGGGGMLRWIRVVDDDNEKAEIAFYFFNSLPSTIADDAAFAPTVADLKKCIGRVVVEAADYRTENSNAIAIVRGEVGGSAFEANADFVSPTGYIYVYPVCTGTPTYTAATDLEVTFGFWLDG